MLREPHMCRRIRCVTTADAIVPYAMHSRNALPPPPKGTSPDISTPWLRLSAASWVARAPNYPTSPRRSPMAPSPKAASNALRGGATTPTSWRRCTFCPMRTSCCVISPCRRWVVYLYPAGNSDRPPIRYNPPFTTGVRGLCHDSQPRFLPARADRPGVGISHALLVVAIGARRSSTDTTHARDATTQTLHGAQTLSGSHPETLLRCL